jgi:hypothetical protein
MDDGSEPADEDVVDLVAFEDCQDLPRPEALKH